VVPETPSIVEPVQAEIRACPAGTSTPPTRLKIEYEVDAVDTQPAATALFQRVV
jgi:hypothetical protein